MKTVVTRFAPSPTGYLHIGGARTALFNWLYARATGGKMLLRIEDTDRVRSTDAAIAAIIDGLKWLELDWDGETVFQFARAARHAEAAYEMLERGAAFRCYVTAEELEARRSQAEAAKQALAAAREAKAPGADIARLEADMREKTAPFRSPYRDGGKPPAPDAPFVVRLKAPRDGATVIDDKVQGPVTFQHKDMDDMVLLRSDGTPTYMLAVVVDDHDMGVTHIIRGDDHLTNAGRQTLIYDALGWTAPAFAHLPLIHGPDGAKLSKRHGALGVEAYRAMGFLPPAMRNYLARLGWAHGDDEIMSTEQMTAWFGFEGMGRSPARLDLAKLENLNGHYIRNTPDDELARQLIAALPHLPGGDALAAKIDEPAATLLARAMPGLKERAKTLMELADGAHFLFAKRPLALDDKAAALLTPDARAHLAALADRYAPLNPWDAATVEAETRRYVEAAGLKLGAVAQPLRAALTGRTTSPGVFDVLAVLGRDEAVARIRDQAALASA
ncbi:MAG: glutamate--tRNA ligase [Hyphomicrobiales bacterium]|nr:glutamate--tRNA ligase [Hyphomicrobiales bacterium]